MELKKEDLYSDSCWTVNERMKLSRSDFDDELATGCGKRIGAMPRKDIGRRSSMA